MYQKNIKLISAHDQHLTWREEDRLGMEKELL
jgi:hypothetical protein